MLPYSELRCGRLRAGKAAQNTSAVASPPVAEVQVPLAEQADQEEARDAFADAISLDCVQKESSLAGKPLERSHMVKPATLPHSDVESQPPAFQEAVGLEELRHRKQPEATSPMLTASSTASDASADSTGFLGGRCRRRSHRGSAEFISEGISESSSLVPDPSHRASIDFSGLLPSGALAGAVGEMLAKPGRGPNLPVLPEPVDEPPLDLTGLPMGGPADPSPAAARVSAGPGNPPVTAERTRSEVAFLEAMPLELPKKKQPPPARAAAPHRSPSNKAASNEALPLEKTRMQNRSLGSQLSGSPGQEAPSWEHAVPLEMTRRRASPKQASHAVLHLHAFPTQI